PVQLICFCSNVEIWDWDLSSLFMSVFHVCCSDPDIDASWYTGRGIRPVGRFGRKAVRRNEHLLTVTAMFESQ
uniref:Prolactin releasing hormone 2 n=1 Tax=Seriola lalandi dorsalis TaxID=1841481 RepID=A0A3B4YFM3_SERLL